MKFITNSFFFNFYLFILSILIFIKYNPNTNIIVNNDFVKFKDLSPQKKIIRISLATLSIPIILPLEIIDNIPHLVKQCPIKKLTKLQIKKLIQIQIEKLYNHLIKLYNYIYTECKYSFYELYTECKYSFYELDHYDSFELY